MKFLINNKEYSGYLAHRTLMRRVGSHSLVEPTWKRSGKAKNILDKILKPEDIPGLSLAPVTQTSKKILENFLQDAVGDDLSRWMKHSCMLPGIGHKQLQKYINDNFSRFSPEERDLIHQKFVKSTYQTLIKEISQGYSDVREFYPRDQIEEGTPDHLFIRNTVNNESLLRLRMDKGLPFLFMDSGYTNFLESNKKWHRLCVNHIHANPCVPKLNSRRMHIFPCLPAPWRHDGSDILVIDPSEIQCKLFDINIEHWRSMIRRELNGYMTRPRRVIFREKIDKKIRESLYQYLQDEDIYCVVNYNSNAAVEAIWAGVPVITLGQHITNPVAAQKLSQIESLARPDLDKWLRYLSYSQYTVEEIANGTAREIMEERLRV